MTTLSSSEEANDVRMTERSEVGRQIALDILWKRNMKIRDILRDEAVKPIKPKPPKASKALSSTKSTRHQDGNDSRWQTEESYDPQDDTDNDLSSTERDDDGLIVVVEPIPQRRRRKPAQRSRNCVDPTR